MPRLVPHAAANDLTSWNLFLDGDVAAWGTLLDTHYRVLFNYGLRFGSTREGVHDCIHDLFLDLWDGRQRLTTRPDTVAFYLLRALRHKLIKVKQKERTYQELDDRTADFFQEAPIDNWLIDQETAQFNGLRLKTLLGTLPMRQQEALYLKFYANFSNQQISELMGLQQQSVANLLHVALQRLRREWGVNTGLMWLIVWLKAVL